MMGLTIMETVQLSTEEERQKRMVRYTQAQQQWMGVQVNSDGQSRAGFCLLLPRHTG